MEKKYGISMKEEEEDSGSGLSKGIQNVTEKLPLTFWLLI